MECIESEIRFQVGGQKYIRLPKRHFYHKDRRTFKPYNNQNGQTSKEASPFRVH